MNCNCSRNTCLGLIEVQADSIWIYEKVDNQENLIMDFEINYCPFCGMKSTRKEKR